MTDIYPYSVLAEDPTTEAVISWVDDRDAADGSEQTLDHDQGAVSATGEEVPESDGVYKYEVEIGGLSPDTDYSGVIDGEAEIDWRTLPESIDGDSVNVVIVSDLHMDRDSDSMADPEPMEHLEAEDPDIFLVIGDTVSNGEETDEQNTEGWIEFWRDYMGILNDERLRPMIQVPGNHDVGNHGGWTGSTEQSVDPDAGYFQFWYKNPPDLDPVGKNYASITVGDYLQILALDSFSEYPVELGDWLDEQIDESVNHIIPINHSPMFPGGFRVSSDDDLQERLRNYIAPHFYDADNLLTHFCGHIHLRKRSVSWSIVDDEPGHDDYFELEDEDGNTTGYVVKNPDQYVRRVVEIGDGWPTDRDPDMDWYLDYTNEKNQFYSVTVDSDSIQYRELDQDGRELERRTFTHDRRIATIGDATLGDVTFGG